MAFFCNEKDRNDKIKFTLWTSNQLADCCHLRVTYTVFIWNSGGQITEVTGKLLQFADYLTPWKPSVQ